MVQMLARLNAQIANNVGLKVDFGGVTVAVVFVALMGTVVMVWFLHVAKEMRDSDVIKFLIGTVAVTCVAPVAVSFVARGMPESRTGAIPDGRDPETEAVSHLRRQPRAVMSFVGANPIGTVEFCKSNEAAMQVLIEKNPIHVGSVKKMNPFDTKRLVDTFDILMANPRDTTKYLLAKNPNDTLDLITTNVAGFKAVLEKNPSSAGALLQGWPSSAAAVSALGR